MKYRKVLIKIVISDIEKKKKKKNSTNGGLKFCDKNAKSLQIALG